ncbi:ATP-binding protein [Treponema primitia]|uniref:ATP-binding protein n=1 Tax=Treponema primitia TaxID=88058 RepID=UPI00025554B2|nr:ATP-binding protein [Treponema primitia]
MTLQRPEYLKRLIGFKDKDLIKVIVGIRRCGKSTLLKLYTDYLRSIGVEDSRIQFINFEDFNNANLTDPKVLHTHILSHLAPDGMNYIFLDEIQLVKDFEKAANSLRLRENIDLYITGSNAYFLSGDLATLLAGRYVSIEMTPLSFSEYCTAMDSDNPGRDSPRQLYEQYLRYSSFPYTLALDNDIEKVHQYLAAIIDTIVLKDVVQRKQISAVAALERLMKFIFNNIGFITSTKKISDTMKSFGFNISVQTVENYLSALEDSFIIHKVGRLDVNGREYLKANDKYYVADIGMRYYLLGDKMKDHGAILENIVYLELRRRGYKVHVGRMGDLEIDFIAFKTGIPEYYQVALTLMDEETRAREMRPLEKIRDNYGKYIITMDPVLGGNDRGIITVNAMNFLLEGQKKAEP